MQGLGLGGEAFGKGLAAKREQQQADIQPEREAATQTQGGGYFGVAGGKHTGRSDVKVGPGLGPPPAACTPTQPHPCRVWRRPFPS